MDFITALFPWITNGPLITVQVMSGLSVGMFLFLVSVGMSLIFGVTRIVNLAHGSFYMVGAYLMVTLVEVLPDAPVGVLAGAGRWRRSGVAALGGVIEMGLLRLIYHRDPLMQLILTFGLILVIGTLVLLAWGPDNKSVSRPEALAGSVKIFGQPFPSYYLLVLALAPVGRGRPLARLLSHALGHADPRRHRRSGDAGRPRRQRGRALHAGLHVRELAGRPRRRAGRADGGGRARHGRRRADHRLRRGRHRRPRAASPAASSARCWSACCSRSAS